MEPPLVIKFGGTSVGGGAEFTRAAGIAAAAAKERPVAVVVSAMSGATDTLLGYAKATGTDDDSHAELRDSLADRHLKAAREAVSEEHLSKVEERLLALLDLLVAAIEVSGKEPAARKAEVAVFGERLSSTILAGAIRSQGTPASTVESDPIATGPEFSASEVDTVETQRRCERYVAPLLEVGEIAVVPGYVGHSPEGLPTTLGRGGSDLSATVIGRALGSSSVWILTDVDGVLDADPRLVPDAALLPSLSYREASIFAELGAKVLHPKTMEPASETGMEVVVRNTFNSGSGGTRVSGIEDEPGVRCVALRSGLPVEIPCTQGREGKASMVVCIGSPEQEDLARGSRSLREAGIAVLNSGFAAAGLVFMVNDAVGGEALRVLHRSLVGASARVEEVA